MNLKNMDEKMRNRSIFVYPILGVIVVLLFLASVSAEAKIGISTPYWKGHDLSMVPGGTVDVAFELQNAPSATEDVTLIVDIVNGSDIAKISDSNTNYIVPIGAKVPVNIRITMPSDVVEGTKYEVRIRARQVLANQIKGPIGVVTEIEQYMPILVSKPAPVPPPTPTPLPSPPPTPTPTPGVSWLVYGIIVLIILIVIIILLRRRKKK